jgi:hypothetical protein
MSNSKPQNNDSQRFIEGAVEKIGLIPRSIIRTVNRFQQQLFPEAVEFFIQEFRVSRSQVLVSFNCLLTLIVIPVLITFFVKTFFFTPFVEYSWNTYKKDIFLNSYQQEQTLTEMRNFEEILYFDLLVDSDHEERSRGVESTPEFEPRIKGFVNTETLITSTDNFNSSVLSGDRTLGNSFLWPQKALTSSMMSIGGLGTEDGTESLLSVPSKNINSQFELLIQKKFIDLAESANNQSILALTNLLADFLTLALLFILSILLKPQIIILKSLLIETFYSLNDTTKSFLLIFSTDLLVGFHSPRGWEIFLDFVLSRFGFPHDENTILLFVATFPVLLDSIIKYWIFRYLNKISPSTVATYHAMIE